MSNPTASGGSGPQSLAGSGGINGSGAGSGGGSSAVFNWGGDGGAGEAFVPSNIEYVDTYAIENAHLKLVAATLLLDPADPLILMTVQNDSTEPSMTSPQDAAATLCNMSFTINLYAADSSFVDAATDTVRAPIFLSDGVMKACLEPGAVGYVAGSLFRNADHSKVTRVEYSSHTESSGFGLRRIATLELSPLSATNGLMVGGSLSNDGLAPVYAPGIFFFAVAASGRPIAFDSVARNDRLDAGATWNFVLSKATSIDRYALFAIL